MAMMRMLQDDSVNNTDLDEEEEVGYPLFYVGIILYSTGAFFLALGVVLQKYSINKELAKAHYTGNEMKSKLRQPLWVMGIVLYGSSGGLLSAALAFAAQSMVTPLMSLVIISNALLARFVLNEPLTKRDLKCILVIVIAVILTTVAAPTTQTEKDTETLIELYKEPLFIAFIASLLTLMLTLFLINKNIRMRKNNHEDITSRQDFLFSLSYGASAGCWGGLGVTMIKSALTIIQDKATEGSLFDTFTEPIVYVLLGVLVMCWYQQLNWINLGLERYPAVFIVSIEAVVNEVVAVTGGLVYFQEYREFDIITGSIFSGGLLLGVVGIIFFALRDNFVGPEADFFTNSKCMNCCKCCNLPLDEEEEGKLSLRTRTIKSFTKNSSMNFVDVDGNPTQPDKDDQVIWEGVDSPFKLITDGAKHAVKSVIESITDAREQPLPGDPNQTSTARRRFSVMGAVNRARSSLLRPGSGQQPLVSRSAIEAAKEAAAANMRLQEGNGQNEVKEEDDASTVPSASVPGDLETPGSLKPSL